MPLSGALQPQDYIAVCGQPTRVEAKAHATTLSAKQHLPVLDGVRAVAVLLVICFHFWQGSPHGAHDLIGKLAVWGQTGVDLFFVLSGFLITGILLDSKGTEHFLKNFYARRILRIFPLYYATILGVFVICPLLKISPWLPWQHSLWYLTYLQNIPKTFAPQLLSGPEHFWSLAVEEHYYMFWPFLVLMLTRGKLLKVICVAIAISLLTRILFVKYETFYFTLARLDGLAIGSALAIFARRKPAGLKPLVPWAKRVFVFLGLFLVTSQLLLSGKGLAVIQISKSTLIAIIYACILILAIEDRLGRPVTKLLSGRVLGSIGKYSYAMYVFHPFILRGLYRAGLPFNAAGLLAGIVLTYAAAWVSWTLFEKRILWFKRYFEYSTKRRVSVESRTPVTSRNFSVEELVKS